MTSTWQWPAACVCDLFRDGEWKHNPKIKGHTVIHDLQRDKKVTDFSSPDTQLHMSFQRYSRGPPNHFHPFPIIKGRYFLYSFTMCKLSCMTYRPRFPSTAAFDPSWLKSSQARCHMVNAPNLDTCRTVRTPLTCRDPDLHGVRLPGEPSSAPHKKFTPNRRWEQKSFLKKVFSQKNPNLRQSPNIHCIKNQHGFFFEIWKKKKRWNHRFHPGISTGIARCSKWNAPPNSHLWTLFEPGFPRKKRCEDPGRPPK